MDTAERQPTSSQELHSHVFKHAPVAIAVAGLQGEMRLGNPAFCTMFGYTPEEVPSLMVADLLTPAFVPRAPWQIGQVVQGNTYPEEELLFKKKDGTEFWAVVEASQQIESGGELEGIIGYFRDVTDRRETEIELQHAKKVVDSVQDMITWVDSSGRIVRANPSATVNLGGSVQGTYVWDHDATITKETWPERWSQMVKDGAAVIRNEIDHFDGGKRILENSITISEHKGDLVNIGIARDVTKRIKSEKRMRRAMFSVDNSRDPIFWTSREGKLLYMNCAAHYLLDYEFKAVIGAHVSTIAPSITPEVWKLRWDKIKEEGFVNIENQLLGKDGNLIHVASSIHYMEMDGDEMVIFQSRDLTAQMAQQKALELRQNRFQSLFEVAPSGVAVTDPEGIIEECNPWFAGMMGYAVEELVGTLVSRLFDPRDMDKAEQFFTQVLSGEVAKGEKRYKRKDGSVFWGRYVGRLVKDENGQPVQILGLVSDQTEERGIRKRQLQTLYSLDQTIDSIAIISADSSYQYVNRSYSKMMGISVGAFDAHKVIDVDHEMDARKWALHWEEMKVDRDQRIHHKLHLDDGSYRYLEVNRSYREFEGEGIIVSSSRDITERYEAMRELSKARHCLDVAADPIAWTNENGDYVFVNPAYVSLYGANESTLLGKNVQDVDPQMTAEAWRSHWQDLKRNGHVVLEVQVETNNGQVIPLELSANYHEFEGVGYNFCFFRDLRTRRETEKKLRESEALFRALFEGSPRGKCMWHPDQGILRANEAFQCMFGYSETELQELKKLDLIHPESHHMHQQFSLETTDSGAMNVSEMRFVRKDGSTFWARRWGMRLADEKGNTYLNMGSLQDITHERAARLRKQKSEESFRILFEESPIGIYHMDTSGMILQANRSWREMFAYDKKDISGMDAIDLIPHNDRQRRSALLKRIFLGETIHTTVNQLAKDGRRVNAKLTALALKDETGKVTGVIGMLEDLEETQKSAALLTRQLELERSNKDLEQFVYVASHDLREPLRSMRTLGEMIRKDYRSSMEESGQRALDFMISASTRMDGLIKGLLDYSRLGIEKQVELVDMGEMVSQIQEDLQVVIAEENATIECVNLPTIGGFNGELRVLLQNLIGNGIKFQQENTSPVVRISCLEDVAHWKLSVADNGIGILPDHLEKIFFIFRRLHSSEEFEGTGIGLAHCKRIAELHGGKIWAESEVGKGSTFHVLISKFL